MSNALRRRFIGKSSYSLQCHDMSVTACKLLVFAALHLVGFGCYDTSVIANVAKRCRSCCDTHGIARACRSDMARRPRTGNARLAIAYIRVSTDDQHLGPEAQRSAIQT